MKTYFHFLPLDGRLQYGDGRAPKDGELVEASGPLEICANGMHASKRALDALQYAPGPLLCKVTLHGETIHGDDKTVARGRTIIARADVTTTLHWFSVWCAERALSRVEKPDPRSLAAVETKKKWLRGEATDKELSAAGSAAWSAAWSAARLAARSAAWSAAARSVAWSAAARSVAELAARSAVWSAELAAAYSAAWSAGSAAELAAELAEREAQNRKLMAMLKKDHPNLFSL
jgi:hypothetical protein